MRCGLLLILFLPSHFDLFRGSGVARRSIRAASWISYLPRRQSGAFWRAVMNITFDGEGRLLVGDGTRCGVSKMRPATECSTGSRLSPPRLGPRGPQGLLVLGDRLYAVGDDGLQLFEGYRSGGPLQHKGRIGRNFRPAAITMRTRFFVATMHISTSWRAMARVFPGAHT